MTPKQTEFDVMASGHLCLDIIPRFLDTNAERLTDILRPGELTETGPAAISTGGAVSNTGIALKKMGCSVCFNARVGDDALGRITIQYIERYGNTDGIRIASGTASAYTIVLALPNIDRILLHYPAANDEYCTDDLPTDLISRCRLFHFGYPSIMRNMFENDGEEFAEVMKAAKEAGATTSCDVTLPDTASPSGQAPWRTILEKALPYIDIFLPSAEEALFMLEKEKLLSMREEHEDANIIDLMSPDDYSSLADTILSLGAKMTSIKAGHAGWYFKTGPLEAVRDLGRTQVGDAPAWADRELWCPAFSATNLASATGSGDSSIAGFLSALLRGLSPEQCLRYAVCLGYQNVQVLDAVSGIKSWEETTAMLENDLPLLDVPSAIKTWKWIDKAKLWAGPQDRLGA